MWLCSEYVDLNVSDLKAHSFLNRTSPATAMEEHGETDGM